MLTSRRLSPALAGLLICLLALSISATAAAAAPVTVNLRVEGSSATLFEGPVSTDAIPAVPGISTASSEGAHPCDVKDNGGNEGFGAAAPTPTAALYDAALSQGLAFDASWVGSLNDFFVSRVGNDVNGAEPPFPSWGYAVNYTTAGVGGCQFQLAPGSQVLWAYNYFNLSHLLSLSGPSSVSAGTPFTVHVADGQTGEPIPGAAIGVLNAGVTTTIPSSVSTDSSGNATIALAGARTFTLKATEPNSVRSNGLAVCVHAGDDGSCGTTVAGGSSTSPTTKSSSQATGGVVAQVLGLINGRVYSRRSAPRVLRGIVKVGPGGTLRQVRIRLHRRVGHRCFNFSGSRERFVRSVRCAPAGFFSVGSAESFSYLLPARLARGRYTYDIQAVDGSGRVTPLVGGVSHVVFRVK
jgi:hypothetical protein